MERRLAAILIADVVDYSRLMGEDEAQTLAALAELRQALFEPVVSARGGKVVKRMGDGWIVEFPNISDAAAGAIEVQEGLSGHAIIQLRIGVHIGDVTFLDDDVYGDGINVAARLEALAEPGQVLISDTTHQSLDGKSKEKFDGGEQHQLKNIARPIAVWRWPAASDSFLVAPAAHAVPDKPSIAVLPFDNMSGDAEQEYFADGIAEDVITALSRFKQFKVIARNSTFAYKGRNVDIRQIARELGVRYVLEGSVRRGGNRLRITGQLIEASDGTHLWADRFDGDLEDVFELQDRITESVVGAIEPTLLTAEIERARRKPPESLAAYDLYLQALPHLYAFRSDENDVALDLLSQAIEKEPNYATAIAYCAWGYEQRLSRGWAPHGDKDAETAIDLANQVLMTGSNDPCALALAGFVLVMVARDYDRGLSAIRRADQLNPNVAFVSGIIANAYIFGGEDLDHALTHMELAIRTSPGDPGAYFYWTAAAFCHYFSGRDEAAMESAQQSVDIYPHWDTTYWVLIPALARLGRRKEAAIAMEKLRKLSLHVTASLLRQVIPFREREMLETMMGGLIDAGLPE